MSKTAFISGVTGQDGAYLSELLLERGYKVYGGVRRTSSGYYHRLEDIGIKDDIDIIEFELSDQENITRTIRDLQPDEFYNLAAQSFVGSSWKYPDYTSRVDGLAVLHILEAIRNYSPDTRFYQASTSEMFGKVHEAPQNENTPFYPRSPYGVAKLYAHWMTKNYRESFDLFAVSGILFNHESPLRGVEFVTRKISLAMANIVQNKQEIIELGNMNAVRDWGYAKDYVIGMAAMLSSDTPNDYLLATGEALTVRDFINMIASHAGIEILWKGSDENEVGIDKKTNRTIVRVNPKFFRPTEVDLLLGDPSLAKKELNWAPTTSVSELAGLMYRTDYDRVASNRVFF